MQKINLFMPYDCDTYVPTTNIVETVSLFQSYDYHIKNSFHPTTFEDASNPAGANKVFPVGGGRRKFFSRAPPWVTTRHYSTKNYCTHHGCWFAVGKRVVTWCSSTCFESPLSCSRIGRSRGGFVRHLGPNVGVRWTFVRLSTQSADVRDVFAFRL